MIDRVNRFGGDAAGGEIGLQRLRFTRRMRIFIVRLAIWNEDEDLRRRWSRGRALLGRRRGRARLHLRGGVLVADKPSTG
jgi:hypothetical protein